MALMVSHVPTSPLWEIRQTPTSGRAVFALQQIKAGTQILCTSQIPASVILRPYKREVCAHCFHYNQGIKLPYHVRETGLYFCTPKCQDAWQDEAGEVGIQAWEKIEGFVRAKNLKKGNAEPVAYEMPDADADVPSVEEIGMAWANVESTAHFVREARGGSRMKPHRRAVDAVLNVNPAVDVLAFQLAGILSRANVRPEGWNGAMALVPDFTPYKNGQELRTHVQSYLHLLCLVPLPLLSHITPLTLLSLSERDSHNSFGIRSLDDGGDEFFGYGVWPEASFFNHSCRPSVSKKRIGRSWMFWVENAVEIGEELCISYLGGDEVGMVVRDRRLMTMGVWGFECGCGRCVKESESLEGGRMEVVVEEERKMGLANGVKEEDRVGGWSGMNRRDSENGARALEGVNEGNRINWMNGFSGMNGHA